MNPQRKQSRDNSAERDNKIEDLMNEMYMNDKWLLKHHETPLKPQAIKLTHSNDLVLEEENKARVITDLDRKFLKELEDYRVNSEPKEQQGTEQIKSHEPTGAGKSLKEKIRDTIRKIIKQDGNKPKDTAETAFLATPIPSQWPKVPIPTLGENKLTTLTMDGERTIARTFRLHFFHDENDCSQNALGIVRIHSSLMETLGLVEEEWAELFRRFIRKEDSKMTNVLNEAIESKDSIEEFYKRVLTEFDDRPSMRDVLQALDQTLATPPEPKRLKERLDRIEGLVTTLHADKTRELFEHCYAAEVVDFFHKYLVKHYPYEKVCEFEGRFRYLSQKMGISRFSEPYVRNYKRCAVLFQNPKLLKNTNESVYPRRDRDYDDALGAPKSILEGASYSNTTHRGERINTSGDGSYNEKEQAAHICNAFHNVTEEDNGKCVVLKTLKERAVHIEKSRQAHNINFTNTGAETQPMRPNPMNGPNEDDAYHATTVVEAKASTPNATDAQKGINTRDGVPNIKNELEDEVETTIHNIEADSTIKKRKLLEETAIWEPMFEDDDGVLIRVQNPDVNMLMPTDDPTARVYNDDEEENGNAFFLLYHLKSRRPNYFLLINTLRDHCNSRMVAPTYKEILFRETTFMYKVMVKKFTAFGVGYKKQHAKHAAAKAMLETIHRHGDAAFFRFLAWNDATRRRGIIPRIVRVKTEHHYDLKQSYLFVNQHGKQITQLSPIQRLL